MLLARRVFRTEPLLRGMCGMHGGHTLAHGTETEAESVRDRDSAHSDVWQTSRVAACSLSLLLARGWMSSRRVESPVP